MAEIDIAGLAGRERHTAIVQIGQQRNYRFEMRTALAIGRQNRRYV
jgi:hypothetical protein